MFVFQYCSVAIYSLIFSFSSCPLVNSILASIRKQMQVYTSNVLCLSQAKSNMKLTVSGGLLFLSLSRKSTPPRRWRLCFFMNSVVISSLFSQLSWSFFVLHTTQQQLYFLSTSLMVFFVILRVDRYQCSAGEWWWPVGFGLVWFGLVWFGLVWCFFFLLLLLTSHQIKSFFPSDGLFNSL